MDQLRTVGEFLWKWRFWFCLGVSLILAIVVQPVGTAAVFARVEQQKRLLDGAFANISKYANGEHPNPTWEEKVKEQETEAKAKVDKIAEEIYQKQAERMTWPASVADVFGGRPFNSDLMDDGGRVMFRYFQTFKSQIDGLRAMVDPITLERDGTVTGKVELPEDVLKYPDWKTAPTESQQAWLAQEQIWIQRAVLEAIARINADAKSWYDAPIRRIVSIDLGEDAIDIRRLAESAAGVKLQGPVAFGAPPAASGQGQGGKETENVVERYAEFSNERRLIPLRIGLLIDQRRIPDVIAGLASIEFAFVVREVSWEAPDSPIGLPEELVDQPGVAPGVGRDARDNTVVFVCYGEMLIYDMPSALRLKWEQSKNPAAAPPSAN